MASESLIYNEKQRSSIYFWTEDLTLTEDEARDFQRKIGYDPMGYGFYGFGFSQNKDKKIIKWYCSSVC
jgi:hypothetical protein